MLQYDEEQTYLFLHLYKWMQDLLSDLTIKHIAAN